MKLKILCIGDLVGGPGRLALQQALRTLIPQFGIDCVIVNAENAANGSGLTDTIYRKLSQMGVNLFTLGDHIYRRKEIIPILETCSDIVRPANLASTAPGKEFAIHQTASGHKVAVISLLGRLFMRQMSNCPFTTVDRILTGIPKDVKTIVVDVHAEATSEKMALGWYLDGRVSAVFGTHTHVTTADERILPKGTAYITDLGMTGPYDSVLGRVKESVIRSMITNVPYKFDVATGDVRVCGILVTVESTTGLADSIERIRMDVSLTPSTEVQHAGE